MDKFEKYIRTHKEFLDADEPNDQLWEKISAKLDIKQSAHKQVQLVPITRLWQVAAAFTVLIVAMVAFQIYYNVKNDDKLVAKVENIQRMNLESLNPELAETEQFYFMQIDGKREELEKYNSKGLKVDSETEKYMMELDIAYKDLKKELFTNNNELVISEMVRNLQIRMDLLNLQLEALRQIEKAKDAKKEKSM
jgi:hypothetical protein